MVEAADIVVNIVNDQWSNARDKLKATAKQFGLLE
jgi:hypothetical protein